MLNKIMSESESVFTKDIHGVKHWVHVQKISTALTVISFVEQW